jgi:hypothetical protein
VPPQQKQPCPLKIKKKIKKEIIFLSRIKIVFTNQPEFREKLPLSRRLTTEFFKRGQGGWPFGFRRGWLSVNRNLII